MGLVVGNTEDIPIFSNKHYQPGNWVIYRKQKSSSIPGPRAENVHAAQKGNLYRYTVDKFWIVERIDDEGKLELRTRRGKRHVVEPTDPQLRKARLWERWIYHDRFEGSNAAGENHAETAGENHTETAGEMSEGSDSADSSRVGSSRAGSSASNPPPSPS